MRELERHSIALHSATVVLAYADLSAYSFFKRMGEAAGDFIFFH